MRVENSSLESGVVAETAAATVSLLPRQGRLLLRARAGVAELGAALGLTLPDRIGRCSSAGGRQAIRLGPDEWTLVVPADEVAGLASSCAASCTDHPYSMVDISGREATLLVEGPQAAELLTLGCSRDIDAIASGDGRRTVFDGVTVVLWRDAEDGFRLDVWNSFVPHVASLLATGCRELAADRAGVRRGG